jgi:hypothetical protein
MRTITGMDITLRLVTDMITRVVPLTGTALGITRICTIGIVSPLTAAAIGAATATPIKDQHHVDLICRLAAIHSAKPWRVKAIRFRDQTITAPTSMGVKGDVPRVTVAQSAFHLARIFDRASCATPSVTTQDDSCTRVARWWILQ